ncbi:hypothetical protein GCK72_003228 [Caenorhabditis remanei]|uniref:Tyrosine-protein phosphatase domain-containing protein n=1 Tax=Caenorhabditis remanei TaxID=31234 RepID=A0A6A5HYM9_CAERE|nr:hypothetical protein GCK72_003228 [Caenorhabditis remanei]KAF1771402.1 hypothetical protein GCK72_003228 [Caenorhabditis remanei]
MAQLSPRIEARHPDFSGRFRHSEEFLNKSPPDDGSIRRFHRNPKDDNLTTSLNHLKMVARVTNGIYLQNGLTSGTIPADKLISELLRFGSVTTTQIAAIDSSKIQKAVDTMKSLPTTLKPSTKVANVEKTLDLFKKILDDNNGITDLKVRPRMNDFNALLTELSTNGVQMGAIGDVISNVEFNWKSPLTGTNNKLDEKTADVHFTSAKQALEAFKSSGAKLKVMPSLWTSKKFSSAEDGIQEDIRILSSLNTLKSAFTDLTRKQDEWSEYSGFIDGFLTTVASLKPAQSDVENVKTVLEAYQLESRKRSLEYISGFSNGPSDMGQISVDLTDQWMKDVVKSDRLSIAMNGLKSLEVMAKKVEDVLKAPNLRSEIDFMSENFNSIKQLASQEKNLKSGIQEAQTCSLTSYTAVTATHVTDLQTVLKGIDDKIAAIEKLVAPLIEAVTAPGLAELCDVFIKICESGKLADVDEFRNHEKFPTLKKAVEKINEVATKIGNVEKPTTIKEDAATAINKLTNLALFHTELDNYAQFFGCLQTKKGVKLLIAAHDRIKTIRSFDQKTSNSLNNGLEVMKKVAGTSEDLKKLKKSIDGMKGVTNAEIDGLKALPDPGKHSKTIGSAVQGVSNMKNALEKKSDLDSLVGGLDVVKKYQSKMKQKELDSLMKLKPTFDSMYKSLTTFESSVTAPKTTTTLADQSEIFAKAKSVTGVSVDLQKIADSVKVLKEQVDDVEDKQKLENLETSIRMADSMGLEFSGYSKSFDGSKATLAALDSFFGGYTKKVMEATSGMKGKEEKPMDLTLLIIAAGILLVTLGSIVLINFVWYKLSFYSYSSTFPCFFPQPNYWKPQLAFFSLAVHRLTTTVNSDYKLYKHVETSESDSKEDPVVNDLVRKCNGLRIYFDKLYKEDTKRANDTVDTKDFGLVEDRPITYSDEKVVLTARDVDPPEDAEKAPANKTKTPQEVDAKGKTPADGKAKVAATATDEKKKDRKTGGADVKTSQTTSQVTSKTEATSKNSKVKSTISKVQKNKTTTKGNASQKPTPKAQPQQPEEPTEKPIDWKDCRDIQKYIKSTRPILTGYGNRFNNDFIAASHFKLPYRKDWYLCESPQTESKRTHSTIGKFWWMVKQKKARMIVMFAETEFARKDCSKYFPLEEGVEESFGGDLKVKCLKIGKDKHGVEYRKLSARFGSEKRFTVTHYWFTTWIRQLRTPERQKDLVKILKTALSQRYPVVVHCPSGAVETSMFALAGHMICNIYKKKTMDFQASLIALRSSCYYALCDSEDYACVGILIMEFFAEGIDIEKIGDEELKKRYLEVQKFWMKWPVTLSRSEKYNYVPKYAAREAPPFDPTEYHSGSDKDED